MLFNKNSNNTYVFSYDDKINLKNKIEKITDKKLLLTILSLINKSQSKQPSINNDCTYVFFDCLNNQTYFDIKHLVDEYYDKYNSSSTVTDLSYINNIGTKDVIDKIKYNNAEKKILKKVSMNQ